MTTPLKRSAGPLRDALYAFSLAKPMPDADLLDDFTRRYPEHADALTDFAIAWVLDGASEIVMPPSSTADVSPAVERAMSRFHNRRYQVRTARQADAGLGNPFDALDRQSLRSLAGRMGVNTVFVAKLRDRVISPDTIPGAFVERLAAEMRVAPSMMTHHLHRRPQVHPRQRFKAEGKPEVMAQQSFEDAVRSSGLPAEQQHQLIDS